MAIRETILIGDPILRETARKVADFSSSLVVQTVKDLTDTMRDKELAGMAAPQIGESLSIFVSEIRKTKFRNDGTDELRVFINPELTSVSHETELGWEGCGSIPGLFGKVERAEKVTVRYFDAKGQQKTLDCSGLLARVVQHEIGHLNGVLFTDLANPETFVSQEYYIKHIRGK